MGNYRRNTWWVATGMVGLLATHAAGANRCVPASIETSQTVAANVATPSILSAWTAKYPTSTLPARMAALTGSACTLCHHPSALSDPGNCYRTALIDLLNQGFTAEQAIDLLDTVDSDGDGVSNSEEATLPRPEPGEVGYNMGLVGDTGTDPCATNPDEPVTGMSETPFIAAIPTVSLWGLVVLVLVQVVGGTLILQRRAGRCGNLTLPGPRAAARHRPW